MSSLEYYGVRQEHQISIGIYERPIYNSFKLLLVIYKYTFNSALPVLPAFLEVGLEKKKQNSALVLWCAFILKATTGSQSLPFDLRLRLSVRVRNLD